MLQQKHPSLFKAKRIISRADNQPTTFIRISFTDKAEADKLIANRRIYIGVVSHRCEEPNQPIRVNRCYNCQGLNHIAKNCPESQPTCPNCAEHHSKEEQCKTPTKHCANCTDNNNHAAYANSCPKYLAEVTKKQEANRTRKYTEKVVRTITQTPKNKPAPKPVQQPAIREIVNEQICEFGASIVESLRQNITSILSGVMNQFIELMQQFVLQCVSANTDVGSLTRNLQSTKDTFTTKINKTLEEGISTIVFNTRVTGNPSVPSAPSRPSRSHSPSYADKAKSNEK